MASKKGGLGRGLDSLLGNAPAEMSSPKESKPVPASEPMPAQKSEKKLPVKQPQNTEAEFNGDSSDADYIGEDNTTIKGVTQREVSKPAATEKSEQQASEQEKQDTPKDEAKATDELDIETIEPNPDQPRTNFKKDDLEELADSIKKSGLLQPIVVRKHGDKYQIVAGERRWQASKLAGLQKVPVRIIEADDDEVLILALIENVQRSDLNPIEEAYGYLRMIERGKMTQTQVAQAVSKGRSTIANALRLLELPEDAQKLLFEEKITAGHARAILSIPDKEGRAKLTKRLQDQKLSVRETEALARAMAGKQDSKKQEKPQTAQTPKSYKTVARSMRDALNTDVRIKSVQGKNRIEISFKDEAELERLYRRILGE